MKIAARAIACTSGLFFAALLSASLVACADDELPTEPSPLTECNYLLNPASRVIDAEGGVGAITVWTQASCAWTPIVNVPWISIVDGEERQGDGSVAFRVDRNCEAHDRIGAIVVGSAAASIEQSGGSCDLIPLALPERK